jgi:NADH-quinone oxidoreductase subunit G
MTAEVVTLKIEGVEVTVPKGTLIVDAAKKIGIDIPVFCYHPKLESVGMCRMCLVEVGRPSIDRATGDLILDDSGQPIIEFRGNLETACTTPVGEGWEIRVSSEMAREGRNQILEFLLTSHPLDCPICDKGGECPLQNLTMQHGPGESRFEFSDKMNLEKHVPLGELIFLDRERCIQCGRCVRFQEELAGDPVLGFTQRGRRLEITTFSDPGFDSYFSGNTTDICPVGALTTADFRFGARPWELNSIASLCPHCPVGCNVTINTRREAKTGGDTTIKRILPRQNEAVNEIWICDKGRFAHHYASSPDRLRYPLVRKGEDLVRASWEEAISKASEGLKQAGSNVVGLASGRLANEDLFLFQKLLSSMGGKAFVDTRMAGGDWVQKCGTTQNTDLGSLGAGDAILVFACDLHEEAPIWWMRVKAAARRGAVLIVANARYTRLDDHATQSIRYTYGETLEAGHALVDAVGSKQASKKATGISGVHQAGEILRDIENLVIFVGNEGIDFAGSSALVTSCVALLNETGKPGQEKNGLIAVWSRNNDQGAWDMGLSPPDPEWTEFVETTDAFYFMGSDPIADLPDLENLREKASFVVVQELFLTETAKVADVVFPARSFLEREGTYTSGERRVQRFYQAKPALGETKSDWRILAEIGSSFGMDSGYVSAADVFQQVTQEIPAYHELSYRKLSEVHEQWPIVGDADLYFGGTSYKNLLGLGVKLANDLERGEKVDLPDMGLPTQPEQAEWLLVPIISLYDYGTMVVPSDVLQPRLVDRAVLLNPKDGESLGVQSGGQMVVSWNGTEHSLSVKFDHTVPAGVVLIPRSMGYAIEKPVAVKLKALDG